MSHAVADTSHELGTKFRMGGPRTDYIGFWGGAIGDYIGDWGGPLGDYVGFWGDLSRDMLQI